jgi:hypothetical protein
MRQNVIDSADGTLESSGNIDHHDPAQKIKDMLDSGSESDEILKVAAHGNADDDIMSDLGKDEF